VQIEYPLTIRPEGQIAAATDEDAHILQMIKQVLFTNPGERVNRPDFGCGLYGMLFEAMSNEMISVTQALVRGNLVRWLGDLIQIEQLTVESQDSTLAVSITYVVLRSRRRHSATLVR
jgi:phage baseplate assembly protein W